MLEVSIRGVRHQIPRDQDYVITTSERLSFIKKTIVTEHKFCAYPSEVVEVTQYTLTEEENLNVGEQKRSDVTSAKVPLETYTGKKDLGPKGDHNNYSVFDKVYAERFLDILKNDSEYKESFLSDLVFPDPEGKEKPLRSKPVTGQRVKFKWRNTQRNMGGEGTGTVVGPVSDLLHKMGLSSHLENFPASGVVVCTDKKNARVRRDGLEEIGPEHIFRRFTGNGYCAVLQQKDIYALAGTADMKMTSSMLKGIPPHIGVVTTGTFVQDGVSFEEGLTGRLVEVPGHGHTTVSWKHKNGHFWNHRDGWANCFSVPEKYIRMCHLSEERPQKALSIWPDLQEKEIFEVGDLVEIHSGRHLVYLPDSDSERMLPPGAIGKIKQMGNNNYRIAIVGGVDLPLLDSEADIRHDYLRKLEETESFFFRGQTVEIIAEIDFRKSPLKGKKAKVVLPTDMDGDVGLEFEEDLQAGSLDGVGENGHCLYVQASTVKASE